MVRISTAGSVDDGKSTLIGRLLYDTKSIFEDQYEAIKRSSEHRGESEVNLALLTDGLRAEREQGITIDVAYRYFATPKRRFIIADTPGHQQYTRNMVTGASTADVAVILVDVLNGMTEQSKRHAFIASLLRIPHIIVVVNKMDLVGFKEQAFLDLKKAFMEYAGKLALGNIQLIPVSALLGDNVVEASNNMPWYRGLPVLEALEEVSDEGRRTPSDLRLPVQYVILNQGERGEAGKPEGPEDPKPQDVESGVGHGDGRAERGFAGQIASGTLRPGEELLVLPSGQRAFVKKLFGVEGPVSEASAGHNVVATLDREIDVSRGDMFVRPRNLPSMTQAFEAVICWMSPERAVAGKTYVLRHTTREVSATVEEIVYRFDVETLHRNPGGGLSLNDIGRVVINTGRPVFLDTYEHNRNTGCFLLIDPVSNNVVAAGMVTRTGRGDVIQEEPVHAEVVWMTGLSGAGKSTIADALVEMLKLDGIQAARLDGDDLRTGLNSDLGFSTEDRAENLRRAAQVAKLFAGLGNVTVCSFITPLESDRGIVREILGGQYIEVYVKTSLAECERRDPKGLYKRARAGEVRQFTGITSAYEPPSAPDLTIETEGITVEEAARAVAEAVFRRREQRRAASS